MLVALTWWEERIVSGIARYAAEHDWVLDCSLRLTPCLPKSTGWHGDGIIAYTGAAHTHEPLAAFLRASTAPKVCLHAELNVLKAPTVAMDHAAIGRLAAEHLLSLHLDHFAFVEFDDNVLENARRAGFEQGLAAAGKSAIRLTFTEFLERLPRLPRPIGLLAANDVNAMDVISASLAAGLRAPKDLAVVGIDNSEVSSRISPVPLTSVACDFERHGYEAAALLDRIMDGETPPDPPLLIAPHSVVVRQSTDTIAIADEDAARALRYLRDHFRQPIRIKELGGEMQGRLRRVQTQFRAATGRTMAEELMRLRIVHAKKLLADPRLKIEFIAYQCGFSNRFHFNHAFRRATGTTPTHFRRELQACAPLSA